jgi:hypothetical protein
VRTLQIAIVFALGLCTARPEQAPSANTVRFPAVGPPVQITQGPREHLFASYYGITSWNASQRYATVLETSVKSGIPTEDQPATLGLLDMQTNAFVPLTTTRAWNFQQGCMAHWLATDPESLIIYNDLRDGRFVSVIFDVAHRREVRVMPFPVAAVSPNGKEAISINFTRLRKTRADYGYGGNGQDPREASQFPPDDGLLLVDLSTGQGKVIVSLADMKRLVPPVPAGGLEFVNHVLYSRDGSRIFWLARATPEWNTTALTCNRDGSDMRRCFPDNWGGSHFDWLDGERLMVTAEYEARDYGHVLFTVGRSDYRRLGSGLLDYDGHGTFSPDGRWMITDTYPAKGTREEKIYLMDMATEAVMPLGRFAQGPEYTGGGRCDIHCRWSPKGDMVGFNSTHTGSRQCYVLRLAY